MSYKTHRNTVTPLINASLLAAALVATTVTTGTAFAEDAASAPIALVNGESITAVDRDTQLQQFRARGQQASPDQALDELISLELMAQEAVKQGLDKSPTMDAEMKIMRARVLANTLLNEFTAKVDTSDEALQAEYQRQVSLSTLEEYNAAHILVEDEAKAIEVIAELDGGADFAESAKKYSTGPSGEKGGDLGWFDSAAMVPEFSTAAAGLEVGKYSAAPVKTEFGFHIIKLNEKRKKAPQPFDSVKAQVKEILVHTKVSEYIDGLHEAAEIERK